MKLPGLANILLFNDSRKVGISVWFYISSEIFFYMQMIDAQSWMACKAMALTLVAGGTLADTYLKKKPGEKIDEKLS